MAYHEFSDRLQFSRGIRESTDVETIKAMLDGCESCVKTDEATDRLGIDYIAMLRRGAKVNIDAKARAAGCSAHWSHSEPELALERWSVLPVNGTKGKTGWTLSESSNVDMILFTFDPQDTEECFLVGFQHLRMAFRRNLRRWFNRFFNDKQDSGTWGSECVFVPASVVMDAIVQVSKGTLATVSCDPEPDAPRQAELFHCRHCNQMKWELILGMCPDCQQAPHRERKDR